MRNYVPPIIESGSPMSLTLATPIAPGVFGYAIEDKGRIFIPDIHAEKEGSGDVGRFLDSLHPRCVIANVVSSRLRGMLLRRGWKETFEEVPEDQGGGTCDVWVRL